MNNNINNLVPQEDPNDSFNQYADIFDVPKAENNKENQTLFSFIPTEAREKIKNSLSEKGITVINPNQIDLRLGTIEQKLLPSRFVFNEAMIESIEIEEIMEGEFHIQIIGKIDQEVLDLEIGRDTSDFQKIPRELLLEV